MLDNYLFTFDSWIFQSRASIKSTKSTSWPYLLIWIQGMLKFEQVILVEWENIPQEIINNMKAVIRARTPYWMMRVTLLPLNFLGSYSSSFLLFYNIYFSSSLFWRSNSHILSLLTDKGFTLLGRMLSESLFLSSCPLRLAYKVYLLAVLLSKCLAQYHFSIIYVFW